MRQLSIAGAVLMAAGTTALLGVAFLATTSRAQGIPSKKVMSELIYEAHTHRYLTTKDAQPFRLVANFRYVYGGVTKTGTYELLWANPERYREGFRLGNDVGETDLTTDGKLYVYRNTKFIEYPLWKLRGLLALPDSLPRAKYVVQHPVKSIQQVAPNVLLVKIDDGESKHFVRTDLTGNEILSDETTFEEKKQMESLALDEFVDFGAVHYASHILCSSNDDTMEVNISKVEQVGTFADSVFAPLADATVQDWCSAPSIKIFPLSQLKAPYIVLAPSVDPEKLMGTYYYEFAADGRLDKVAKLYPDGTATELKVNEKARALRPFPLKTCAGKPIPYSFVSSGFTRF
jgi:hypothetical protein